MSLVSTFEFYLLIGFVLSCGKTSMCQNTSTTVASPNSTTTDSITIAPSTTATTVSTVSAADAFSYDSYDAELETLYGPNSNAIDYGTGSWTASFSISLVDSTAAEDGQSWHGGETVRSSGGSVPGRAVNWMNLTIDNTRCDRLIKRKLISEAESKDTQPIVPQPIDVKVIAIALNDVSDVNEIISMTTRIDFRWTDPRLALPKNKSCRGHSVLVKTTDLWFPYFLLQNGAYDIIFPDAWEKYPSILYSQGRIDWRVPMHLAISCQNMDVSAFPFDIQYCMLLIQSPHYGYGQLNYTVGNLTRGLVILHGSLEHPLWSMTGQAVKFTTQVPGIQFWFRLRRKPSYYAWTLFLPMLAACIQVATTFIIPADGDEKISSAINGLLSFFFLFLIFAGQLPQTSQTSPGLMIFYGFNILFSVGSIVAAAFIERIILAEEGEMKEEFEDDLKKPTGNIKMRRRSLLIQPVYEKPGMNRIAAQPLPPVRPPPESAEAGHSLSYADDKKNKGRKCKWIFVSAAFLNDLCLVIYVALVVVSFLITVIYLAVNSGSNAPPDVTFTDMETYIVGE